MEPMNPKSLQLVEPVSSHTESGLPYILYDSCQIMGCPNYYKAIAKGCTRCVLYSAKNPKKYLDSLLEGT